MELERHLSASAVSRVVPASSVSSPRYDHGDEPDFASLTPIQPQNRYDESDRALMASDRVHDSRERMESAAAPAAMPGHTPSQVLHDHANDSSLESHYESNDKLQSKELIPTPFLDPSLMGPLASRGSDRFGGTSERQELANPMPVSNTELEYDGLRASNSSDQSRGSDPAHVP